ESPAAGPGSTRRYTRAWERAPERLDLVWRPYRPELRVDSLVDVALRSSLAAVRHRLEVDFRDRIVDRVTLQIPAAVGQRLRVLQGGSLDEQGQLKLDRAATKATIQLAYDVPLSGRPGGQVWPLAFVRLPAATRTEIKARFWCESTQQLGLAEGPWDELGVEAVPDRDSLPSLVLRSVALEPAL